MTLHRSLPLDLGAAGTTAPLVKLFSVTVTHTFYPAPNHLCADFSVEPTPAAAALMARLGIAVRSDEAGFSVFIQSAGLPGLGAYLAASATRSPDGEREFWQRLTFSLRLKNKQFIGITNLPLDTVTNATNLYVSNLDSHPDQHAVVLAAPGARQADSLHDVVGAETLLSLPEKTTVVEVEDISGTVVLRLDNIPRKDRPLQVSPPPHPRALLELGTLPHGRYTITARDAKGHAIGAKPYPRTVLYTAQRPDALVLLDLLFTRPASAARGIYPLAPPFGPAAPTLDCVRYQLPFAARLTHWHYFVVSQDPHADLRELRISGTASTFAPPRFPVLLPDGSNATLFVAEQPLPLQQRSTLLFKLSGKRHHADSHHNQIHIARLPVAPSAPVWHVEDMPLASGISEIFVYV